MAVDSIAENAAVFQGNISSGGKMEKGFQRLKEENMKISDQPIGNKAVVIGEKSQGQDEGISLSEKQKENFQLEQNEQIKKAVKDINKSVSGTQSEAVFGIHEETNRVTIKIVDKKTKEVLKEFPPEKTLDMIAKVWESAGIMLDEKR